MTKKETAAFEVVARICADFLCNQRDRVVVQTSLQLIHAALNPKTDEKKEDEEPEIIEEPEEK